METFCTYFDANYLCRFLPMYWSLKRNCRAGARIYALCLDNDAEVILEALALPGVECVSLERVEVWDPRLLQAKANRSKVEYYFTLTPALPLFLLSTDASDAHRITYLDADLYFFSPLEEVFSEIGDASIAIVPHRFPEQWKTMESRGVYNVGFEVFRNNEVGLRCLRDWLSNCLEWCYDCVENGRYADQKYLDSWPSDYPGSVCVVKNPGANVAPWNVQQYAVRSSRGVVCVGGAPLVFYHFAGFRFITEKLVDPEVEYGGHRFGTKVWRHILVPYVREVLEARKAIGSVTDRCGFGITRSHQAGVGIQDYSLSYCIRLAMERKAVVVLGGRTVWFGSENWQHLVSAYDAVRRKFGRR